MNFANLISSVSPNVYGLYYVTRFLKSSNNKAISKLACEFSSIDSIEDFDSFLVKIEEINRTKELKKLVFPNSENVWYGHLINFYQYAGINYKETPFIHVEHGVNFAVDQVPELKFDYSTIMIFQSKYKNDLVHKRDSFKPTFAIGPYLHYTKPYYESKKMEEIKKKYGKTVVIYLGHSWEKFSIERNYEEYSKVVERFSSEFDSIVFCLYWADCSKELTKRFCDNPKVHFVSAGFRIDPLFLSRTRSILELADVVASNDIGTSIGYAIYLKKPIIYFRTGDRIVSGELSKRYNIAEKNRKKIINAIKNNAEDELNSLYNEFWGGDCIKTPDEMKEILLFADHIAKDSFGFKRRFSSVTKKIIESSDSDLLKASIMMKE